jgi:spermidine/putrescine-binding protein
VTKPLPLLDTSLSSYRLSRRQFLQTTGSTTMALASFGAGFMAASRDAAAAPNLPAGELVFAGWQGEDDQEAAKAFVAQTRTTIRSTYVASGDELLTKLRSGGLGSIDIVSQNKDYIPLAIRAGYLEPLDRSKIPNAANIFPVLAQAPWLQSDGHQYAVPLTWGDSPIIWDPRKWDGPPAKYSDLAATKYKGALTCLDDPYSIFWLFSSSLGHPDPARITQAQLDETVKLARAVKKNIVLIGSFGDATDVIVRGDASIAFAGWEQMVNIAAQKGKVLKSGLTTVDKGFLWADAYSIPKGSPNTDRAYAFINHMLSPAADAILASKSGSAAVSDAAVQLMPAQARNQYDYTVVKTKGSTSHPMDTSVLPPLAPDGEVVGIAAWRKAWQEFKS